MKEIKTYPLRLPRSLKEAVERLSKEDRTSINQFVATRGGGKGLGSADREVLRRSAGARRFRGLRPDHAPPERRSAASGDELS